jgi:segregation and condensation protein B
MSDVNSELKNIIEAALLAAGEPLTLDRMLSLFPTESRPSKQEIGDALKMLEKDYEGRGIELKRAERSYRFQTHEKYGEWISRLHQERPPRYSRALLETLAIIAYRQPVTRGDIEEIRGVSVSSELFRTLLVREWIHQVGHRDVPGRPGLYGTTRKFAEHFNLTSLDELPPLAEMRNLEEIGKELGFQLGTQSELPIASGVGDQADLISPEVDAVQADDQQAPRDIESPEPAHDHTRVGES